MTKKSDLIPHLFRSEYSKLVSVLCKLFGFAQIEIAEDIASETFLTATETWGLKGLPENPTAWLYLVAKNKAKNYIQRDSFFQHIISSQLLHNFNELESMETEVTKQIITDTQLQMMFALCHPVIPIDAQIGLSLRILCGFGIEEIAAAFLSNKETINKKLFRAKQKLREEKISIEFPSPHEVNNRLEAVLTTLYLLFSEGYYSESQNSTLRKELCLEAMRLCNMLVENQSTDTPSSNALLSLMCFHSSRFEARLTYSGEAILYGDQNAGLWNDELIQKGSFFLSKAASGKVISKYHLEAGIAYWHTHQLDTKEKWESILQLYNQLLQLEYSPIAALNRTYVLSKVHGEGKAILEAEKLKLSDNYLYFTLLGELYKRIDKEKAKAHLKKASEMCKTKSDRQTIQQKIDSM